MGLENWNDILADDRRRAVYEANIGEPAGEVPGRATPMGQELIRLSEELYRGMARYEKRIAEAREAVGQARVSAAIWNGTADWQVWVQSQFAKNPRVAANAELDAAERSVSEAEAAQSAFIASFRPKLQALADKYGQDAVGVWQYGVARMATYGYSSIQRPPQSGHCPSDPLDIVLVVVPVEKLVALIYRGIVSRLAVGGASRTLVSPTAGAGSRLVTGRNSIRVSNLIPDDELIAMYLSPQKCRVAHKPVSSVSSLIPDDELIAMYLSRRKPGVVQAPNRGGMFNQGLRTTESASDDLLRAVQSKGRTIDYALPGSDELRYLDYMKANANVGGENMTNILLRQNPTKVEVLEEFLHGTQFRRGIVDWLGVQGAEVHVKEFMLRHLRLLGITDQDAAILRQMMGGQ